MGQNIERQITLPILQVAPNLHFAWTPSVSHGPQWVHHVKMETRAVVAAVAAAALRAQIQSHYCITNHRFGRGRKRGRGRGKPPTHMFNRCSGLSLFQLSPKQVDRYKHSTGMSVFLLENDDSVIWLTEPTNGEEQHQWRWDTNMFGIQLENTDNLCGRDIRPLT